MKLVTSPSVAVYRATSMPRFSINSTLPTGMLTSTSALRHLYRCRKIAHSRGMNQIPGLMVTTRILSFFFPSRLALMVAHFCSNSQIRLPMNGRALERPEIHQPIDSQPLVCRVSPSKNYTQT
jgi:hypothetical protein